METNPEDVDEQPDEAAAPEDQQQSEVVERLRDSPVGTNDPNIVGDVGPLDIPPGKD